MQINPLDQVRSSMVLTVFVFVFFVLVSSLYELAHLPSADGVNLSVGEAFTRDNLIWACTYPLIGFLLWMLTRHHRDELAEMLFNVPAPAEVRQYLWLGAGMLVSAIGFSYVLFYPISLFAPEFVQSWLLDSPALLYWDEAGNYWLGNLAGVVMAVCFAPILEEYLFRGYLLNRWTLKFGAWPATLLSSFLFAVLHPDVLGAFVFAVFQCLLYMKTRSLIGPMLIHFSNNLLAVLLEWMDLSWWSGFAAPTLQDFYDQWWTGLLGVLIGVPWLWRYAKQHFFPIRPLLLAHEHGGETENSRPVG